MNTKVCKRCGIEKPLEEFRHYYGGKKGTYTFCKTCERIEQRRKYIVGKREAATPDELEELRKIDELYEKRRSAGLVVPSRRDSVGVASIVDAQLVEMR